jgi:uncharacterized membrane protein YfcA
MGELSAVNLILFVSATFAASFVAGLAGFAFAIVAAAVWLHFLPRHSPPFSSPPSA